MDQVHRVLLRKIANGYSRSKDFGAWHPVTRREMQRFVRVICDDLGLEYKLKRYVTPRK